MFLQKAFVFKNPKLTEKLCAALADKIRTELPTVPDIIVAPAMGGVIPGYEMARQLSLESIFVEREGGEFVLRRGFALEKGAKVLMVEDIISTGLSSRECIAAITAAGGENIVQAPGWQTLDPETLITLSPDIIMTSFFNSGYESVQAKAIRHTVLVGFIASRPVIDIPGPLWPCAGPDLIDAAELIADGLDRSK